MLRLLLALLLIVESLSTALWVLHLLPVLVVYDWIALVFIAARAGVGVFQFASGSMLFRRQAMGPLFARRALLVSAVLLTAELGLRLTPSSLFPGFRWPVIAAYWTYSLGAWAYLRFGKRVW